MISTLEATQSVLTESGIVLGLGITTSGSSDFLRFSGAIFGVGKPCNHASKASSSLDL